MIRLVAFIFLLCPVFAYGYGSPNYLPDGDHPRIWLTSDELTKLNAKQSGADRSYKDLIAWCDEHINDPGYDEGDVGWNGYRGSGYWKYLLNFALGYQILKDDNPTKALTYANYVRTILIDGIYKAMSAGDEYNGLAVLRCGESVDRTINADERDVLGLTYGKYKLGYSTRNIGAVPIAYDWIHESGVLSSADKTNLTSMMYRWFDWIRGVRSDHNNGVLVGSTRYHEDTDGDCTGINNCTTRKAGERAHGYGNIINNFMGGHSFFMLLVPLATYGDHFDAGKYLNASKALISDTIIAQLNDPLKHAGGDSVEGWNYGSSYWSTLQGLYGHYTATGEAIFSDFYWPTDLVAALVHRSQSDMVQVPIYGDWTGPPVGENRLYQMVPLIGISQRISPSASINEVGQYFLENASLNSTKISEWQYLLWYNPDYTATEPTSLDLAHYTAGHGFVTSRSSWTNASDTVHLSVRLEGKWTASHESYDEGTITLMRGTDRLLTHRNMARESDRNNVVVFNNFNHQALNLPLTETAIDRYYNTPEYMYVSGDITNAWKRKWKVQNALMCRRSVLHIRPNVIVIYDVTQSNKEKGTQKDFYTQYEVDPKQADGVITATNGNSRIFVKTLYPKGTLTEDEPNKGYFRVKFTPFKQQEYEQFLTVLETAGSSDIQAGTSMITGTVARGALIDNTIAMFTDDPEGAHISDLTYTVDATEHYIADLPFNKRIDVKRSGVQISGSPFDSGRAGIIRFSAAAGRAVYDVSVSGKTVISPLRVMPGTMK